MQGQFICVLNRFWLVSSQLVPKLYDPSSPSLPHFQTQKMGEERLLMAKASNL